jgi:hypothetical protein
MRLVRRILFSLLPVLFLFPTLGSAALTTQDITGSVAETAKPGGLTKVSNIDVFANRTVSIVMGILGTLLLLVIVYGGILYITAGGDVKKTQAARHMMINAVIGIVIIFGSYVLIGLVVESVLKLKS